MAKRINLSINRRKRNILSYLVYLSQHKKTKPEPTPEPPPSGVTYSITAANFNDSMNGYGTIELGAAFGTLDTAEPFAPNNVAGTLQNLGTGYVQIFVLNDVTAEFAGKSVWINGTEYVPALVEFTTVNSYPMTSVTIDTAPPGTIAPGNSYSIEIK